MAQPKEPKVCRIISIGRAEIETTELGYAAFEGRLDVIGSAIADGIDWDVEKTDVLHGALYGGKSEIAELVLRAGSPIEEASYFVAYDYLPSMLALLPPRPELVEKIEASRRWPEFIWALIDEDIELARTLLGRGVPINDSILVSHGIGLLPPIHYAARAVNVDLLRLCADAGADCNALTTNGKSPLRVIAEDEIHTSAQRRAAIQFLAERGGAFHPPINGWLSRFMARCGRSLRS